MPRAALLSIHARMAGTEPASWEDPSLVQVWGPRFSTYVVAKCDLAIFTISRLPDKGEPLKRAQEIAAQLRAVLAGRRMVQGVAARAMGKGHPNRLRYAALTGTVLIRWDGSHQPDVWNVPAPEMDPQEARLELARRYLHVFGPSTPKGFAGWAGINSSRGIATFKMLGKSLAPVRTPIGEGWILGQDEPLFRAAPGPVAPARLLPSGDTWFLLQSVDRELLVPNEASTPRIVDVPRVAWRHPARRGDCRHLAARGACANDPAMASPFPPTARSGRDGSKFTAPAGNQPTDGHPLE